MRVWDETELFSKCHHEFRAKGAHRYVITGIAQKGHMSLGYVIGHTVTHRILFAKFGVSSSEYFSMRILCEVYQKKKNIARISKREHFSSGHSCGRITETIFSLITTIEQIIL